MMPQDSDLLRLDVRPPHGARRVGVLLDVLAGRPDGPELAEERALVAVVEVAQLGLDGVCGLLGLVERDATALVVSIGPGWMIRG